MALSTRDALAGYDHVTEHRSVALSESAFGELLTACHERLTEVAREGGTITYRELAGELGLGTHSELRPLLDAIAYVEHELGRPPLPVLVVKGSTGKPGVDFFDTIDRLGLRSDYRAHTDNELLAMMSTNVYGTWQE